MVLFVYVLLFGIVAAAVFAGCHDCLGVVGLWYSKRYLKFSIS